MAQPHSPSHTLVLNRNSDMPTNPHTKYRQHSLRRSQRLAKQRRAQVQFKSIMGSTSSSNTSATSGKRTRKWKQKPALRPKVSPPERPEDDDAQPASFFEAMTDAQLMGAFSYYYDHPEEFPYRESGAFRRAKEPTPDVLVRFDQEIFSRKMRLRPVGDDDLESVDPFSLDAGGADVGVVFALA